MFVSTILFKFIFQTNAIAATGKTRTTRRERTVEMVAKATMAVVEVDLDVVVETGGPLRMPALG